MSSILVVVDMQNDFVSGVLGTNEAVAIVPKVVSKIKEFEGKIIYTKDTHNTWYLESQEGKNLPVVHCMEGTEGWELVPEIKRLQEEAESPVFLKPTFGSVNLSEYLKELSARETIDEIQLIGVCTDICVISNAMIIKAYLPEVKIVVDSACCAGVTKESHETAINAMRACQIEIR